VTLHSFDLLKELDYLRRTYVKGTHHYVHLSELQEFHGIRRRFSGKHRMRLTQQPLQLS
jgi:hypothetical protein